MLSGGGRAPRRAPLGIPLVIWPGLWAYNDIMIRYWMRDIRTNYYSTNTLKSMKSYSSCFAVFDLSEVDLKSEVGYFFAKSSQVVLVPSRLIGIILLGPGVELSRQRDSHVYSEQSPAG